MQLPQKPFSYQMFIDGKWTDARSSERFQRESPAHDAAAGDYPSADAADVDQAVAAARKAFDGGGWPSMKGADRAALLRKVADLITRDSEHLAFIETLESGKPISQARGEMEATAGLWQYAATLAYHVYGDSYNALGADMLGLVLKEPVGVVGMITPWNFPLLIISQKLPFALAVGCTAVVKPSELTPGTTLHLAKLLEEAGLPPGVVNIVTGDGVPVGSRLSEHPDVDMISFTGSTEVGKKVVAASQGNLKKVSLELGGKNPQIVFADADLDAALDAVVFGVYFNMGECCNSGSRLLVQEEIADDFVKAVVEQARTVPVGDPLDESTKVGAIINQEQFDKIMNYVNAGRSEGANVCLGGGRLKTVQGLFIEPTVFDGVKDGMKIAGEEIFGPVLSVIRFKDAEEATAIANNVLYGLSAGIWTRDVDTALNLTRSIRAGTIWVNSFMDGYPELPFGGYKESGLGRELGRFSIDEFLELKTVQLHIGARTNWWHRP